MIHSIKTLFCVLAFVSLSRAETWEDTVTVGLLGGTGVSYFSFDDFNIVIPSNTNSNDVSREASCITGDEYACFYYFTLVHGRSKNGSIWTVKDTSALDFIAPFDLSDTSIFAAHGISVELDSGKYGFEQYFIFLLGSGNYAFCHGTLVDTTFIWAWNGFLVSDYVRMPLACQVQEDGTPTFDSIPQYNEPPLALPLLRLHTMQKQSTPSAPYRVNGTSANTSTATGIRVGKETTIRDK